MKSLLVDDADRFARRGLAAGRVVPGRAAAASARLARRRPGRA